MRKKKTTDRYLRSKYHEEDFIQVNLEGPSISISQKSDEGKEPQKIFLTFEAIEELYNEVQQHRANK